MPGSGRDRQCDPRHFVCRSHKVEGFACVGEEGCHLTGVAMAFSSFSCSEDSLTQIKAVFIAIAPQLLTHADRAGLFRDEDPVGLFDHKRLICSQAEHKAPALFASGANVFG